ncbi:hypothetical protein Tco_1409342 [Tanacetum coccineum]
MVLYFVPDDVHDVPAISIPAIPAPHWDDVIVISIDEEYSSDDEKDDIPEDDCEELNAAKKVIGEKKERDLCLLFMGSDSDEECWSNAFLF